mmetsp:Transcript_11940/g.37965  ORF Transcript_11940/g.37965 Transcript_11940/m.37965 type:complete len:496 (+) Transcript_11940:94-1581(+)
MAAHDSIILEEDIDETYDPTPDEIDEYATWLGMRRPEDDDLLWIASEGLKAPLPEHWKPCRTQDGGEIYYFNFATGESVWDHPCDDYYRKTYEEEKAKKLRRSAEGNGRPAAAPSSPGLGRQPPGGPIGLSALGSAARPALAPIGSASGPPSPLSPGLASSGLASSVLAAGSSSPSPLARSAPGARGRSEPGAPTTGPLTGAAAAEASGTASGSNVVAEPAGGVEPAEVVARAREARERLVEMAAAVESELEQERDATLEETRRQLEVEGRAEAERIRAAQREASERLVVEAGDQLREQMQAHAEAALAAERVAIAARRRAVMEEELEGEIAELEAAKAAAVDAAKSAQAAAAAAAAAEAVAALEAREAAVSAREAEMSARLRDLSAREAQAASDAEALVATAQERAADVKAAAEAEAESEAARWASEAQQRAAAVTAEAALPGAVRGTGTPRRQGPNTCHGSRVAVWSGKHRSRAEATQLGTHLLRSSPKQGFR